MVGGLAAGRGTGSGRGRALGADRPRVTITTKQMAPADASADALMAQLDASLERLGTDYVDLHQCHRADPDTPMEETVWAMSDMVTAGKATYWGTSEWNADEIRHAIDIAERHHLHKPVTEQSQYNLLERKTVEREYARLTADYGYGNTIWSPLASGLLTGKYRKSSRPDSGRLIDNKMYSHRYGAGGEIEGVAGDTYSAGKLGEYTIAEDGTVLLGPPTVFDADNIDDFDF